MEYFTNPDFRNRISQLTKENNIQQAIDEIKIAIKSAKDINSAEETCYLYSMLFSTYFNDGQIEEALAVLEELEAKFNDNIEARFIHLENLFWYLRDYNKVISKADEIMDMFNTFYNIMSKTIYLKGLAYVEIKEYDKAVDILNQTEYYDLMLPEKLISHGVGLNECRNFLLKALSKHETYKARGENAESTIKKIKIMISQLSELGIN